MKPSLFRSRGKAAPHPPHPRKLVLFPYAGASVFSYAPVTSVLSRLGEPVVLSLPGRGEHYQAPSIEDFDELVAAISSLLLESDVDAPVFLGHSMGARVACAVAKRLEGTKGAPSALVLSASAPKGAPREFGPESLPDLEDGTILNYLTKLGGTPAEVLAEPFLRRLIMNAVRSDLKVLLSQGDVATMRLSQPALVLCGDRDPALPPSLMEQWAPFFENLPRVRVRRGGHFFPFEDPSSFAHDVEAFLDTI